MKQAGYTKRPRGRSFERRNPKNMTRDAIPEIKGRGNPQQFVDKYLSLAREATSSGDPVTAESYYQYADHYYRLVVALRPQRTFESRQEAPQTPQEIEPPIGAPSSPPESVPSDLSPQP